MKNAIVTGTSSGFGMLIAIELAKTGFQVTATMRDVQKSGDLLRLAGAEKVDNKIQVYPLDVTSKASICAFSKFLEQLPSVDVLVNNAGYAQGGFCEELSLEDYRNQFETNFFGAIGTSQAVIPIMRRQKTGLIMNMSSISGKFGFPGLSAYTASKHALEGFSESLRLELKPFGIDVVLIEPGSYRTNIWQSIENASIKEHSPYEKSRAAIMNELKNGEPAYGDPLDVANLVVNIASSSNEPELRYPIGKGVKNMIRLKKLLPWKVIEKIVMKKLDI